MQTNRTPAARPPRDASAAEKATATVTDIHAAIGCLQRLAEAFHVRRGQLAATVGLTDHQWGVLEEIASRHFMPSLFARRRQSSAAAISKTLRQLLDRGLVKVTVGAEDGRRRAYALTPKGERLMGQLRQARLGAIDRVWKDLEQKDLRGFVTFSTTLADRLERYAAETGNE